MNCWVHVIGACSSPVDLGLFNRRPRLLPSKFLSVSLVMVACRQPSAIGQGQFKRREFQSQNFCTSQMQMPTTCALCHSRPAERPTSWFDCVLLFFATTLPLGKCIVSVEYSTCANTV
mmetsp:Transcript_18277/g.50878  ORF Transcript_18277/g.50878 Transcript_18277/m.50878 type:complete len:118 (+) Transcript_18277:2255-2608(+)